MKKLLFTFTALALLFVACEKDSDKEEAQADASTVEFKIDQSSFDFKSDVPECSDAVWHDVQFTIKDANSVETTYTSLIFEVDAEHLTQVVKLDPGDYTLTSFLVRDADENIIRAAPLESSIYYDLMTYKLELPFTVEPFYKKQVEVDVLCYEDLAYDDFGFTWFQFNDVKIERQCFFGDICAQSLEDFEGTNYDPIQFDMVALMQVEVYKVIDDVPVLLRTFNNYDIEGDCMEVYWPNRLNEVEEFEFRLYVETPNGLEHIKTWEFEDDNCPNPGDDGVVEFVIGDCNLTPTDYQFPAYEVTGAGGGDVQVTLTWDTEADLDLWVTDPDGFKIYYGNAVSPSGGMLDFDDTNGYGPENTFWLPGTAPNGSYFIQVDHYYDTQPTNYTVTILFFGTPYTFTGTIGDDETIDIVELNTSKSTVTPLNSKIKHDPMPAK
jgi:hypothetical protein